MEQGLTAKQLRSDNKAFEYITALGYKLIRIGSMPVEKRLELVLQTIKKAEGQK